MDVRPRWHPSGNWIVNSHGEEFTGRLSVLDPKSGKRHDDFKMYLVNPGTGKDLPTYRKIDLREILKLWQHCGEDTVNPRPSALIGHREGNSLCRKRSPDLLICGPVH
jgi:hypothetical protein